MIAFLNRHCRATLAAVIVIGILAAAVALAGGPLRLSVLIAALLA